MGNGCAQGVNKEDTMDLKAGRKELTERNATTVGAAAGGKQVSDAKGYASTTTPGLANSSTVGTNSGYVNTSMSNAKPAAGYSQGNVFSYNFPTGNNSISTYSAGINAQPVQTTASGLPQHQQNGLGSSNTGYYTQTQH